MKIGSDKATRARVNCHSTGIEWQSENSDAGEQRGGPGAEQLDSNFDSTIAISISKYAGGRKSRVVLVG